MTAAAGSCSCGGHSNATYSGIGSISFWANMTKGTTCSVAGRNRVRCAASSFDDDARVPSEAELLTPTSVPMMKTRIETRGCSLLPFIANFLYAASALFEQSFSTYLQTRVPHEHRSGRYHIIIGAGEIAARAMARDESKREQGACSSYRATTPSLEPRPSPC